jgi:hypothetical protein
LLGQHELKRIRLVIPEVVIRELPKLFKREYDATRGKLQTAADKMRELGSDPVEQPTPNPDEAADTYEADLRRALEEKGVQIAEIPEIDIGELVDQAVAERRPFQANSKGFRDAVIWRTIRELAEEDEVVLITKNTADFAESDQRPDTLHRHLREDLESAGQPGDRVRLLPSLEEYIDRHVPSEDKALHFARQLYADDPKWNRMLWDAAEKALWQLEIDRHDDVTVLDTEASIDNVSVLDAGIENIEISEAYETGEDGVVSLEIRVHAILNFSFTVDGPDAEWLVEEKADMQIDVWEATWVQGSTMARYVEVTYAADFDVASHELSELEKVVAIDEPAHE